MEEGRKEQICIEIMQNCRNQLYCDFPFFDGAFAKIRYRTTNECETFCTDGRYFYYNPDYLLKKYLESPECVIRGYLHMLIHCLYLHIFPEENVDRKLWNLACDLSAELIMDIAGLEDIKEEPEGFKRKWIQKYRGKSFSVQQIYGKLQDGCFFDEAQGISSEVCFDDHKCWYEWESDTERIKTRKKWEKILFYTGEQREEQTRNRGSRSGNKREEIVLSVGGTYDYRKFLKQFTFPREEVELDTESFDYIFYHFGMTQYGNMPLIEPLEYREVNRLEELVIAIDTSGSCSKETVQDFLGETYRILSNRENFFRKMKVYLIQCDCCIQDVTVIHSEEEWKNYSRKVQIQGRAGTDFRPVFVLVNKLKKKKELKNLKALIYFTDGDGIYPENRPEYETAFVFLKASENMNLVPAWAEKLLV